MKRFLKLHFNFEDDLRRAAAKAEEAGNGGSAGTLLWYADELHNYKPERLYLLQGFHGGYSSLKVWQRNTLRIAEQYENYLFTEQEIDDLANRLSAFSKTQKNCTEEICRPEWEKIGKYGIDPLISIGSGCSVSFIRIKGDYEY